MERGSDQGVFCQAVEGIAVGLHGKIIIRGSKLEARNPLGCLDPAHTLAIIPGKPEMRMKMDVVAIDLNGLEIIHGIFPGSGSGGQHTEQDRADVGAMIVFEKQNVLPEQDK